MSPIHIIPREFNRELELKLAYSIKAGFPSLACLTTSRHFGKTPDNPSPATPGELLEDGWYN